MGGSLVVSGLMAKRAAIAGEIEALETRIAGLQASLVHLDATIRIMDPEADPETIRPKIPQNVCDWFGRGELFRLTMGLLRDAAEPMSTLDLAQAVLERKAMAHGGRFALRRVMQMIGAMLRRRKGLVEMVPVGQRGKGWRVSSGES